jgi:hypothetical protein
MNNQRNSTREDDSIVFVSVKPRAQNDEVIDFVDGVLHVKLRALPEKGRANAALIALLADYFDIAKSRVEIESGSGSRKKKVRLHGCSVTHILKQKGTL